jgi:hypothetical protein
LFSKPGSSRRTRIGRQMFLSDVSTYMLYIYCIEPSNVAPARQLSFLCRRSATISSHLVQIYLKPHAAIAFHLSFEVICVSRSSDPAAVSL